MFIAYDDFKMQIKEDRLEAAIEEDPTILDKAILAAQSEAESYLNNRFDMDTTMSRVGDARSQVLVMYIVDLAIYHLSSKANPRNVSQLRQDRYDTAIKWLESVNAGKITPPDMVRLTSKEQNSYGKWGSKRKPSTSW